MCYSCYVVDDGEGAFKVPEPAPTAETDRLVELINKLYGLPRCEMGGPLHCELDDWNLDAEVITPSYETSYHPDNYSPEVHEVCDEITAIMKRMTEDQRLYALAVRNGYVKTSD